jgi:heat shock protein HslJ
MTFHWRSVAQAMVATLLLGAAGCGPEVRSPTGASAAITRDELDGRKFLLTSSVGYDLVASTNISLSFRDGELSASAGCNHLGGPFDIREAALVVNGLGMTEIGCGAELHAQDQWLATFLSSRPRITRRDDQLTLAGESATLTFLDREVADPDQPLAGAAWSIDTFLMNDAASNLPLSKDPTLTFHADGTLEVDTTCNTSRGTYTVTGDTLELSGISYTEKACSGPASYAEQSVQAVIEDGPLKFTIDARRLTIERGNVGLSAMRMASTDAPSGALTPATLNGLHYLLEQAQGFSALPGAQIHLIFDDQQISFSAGCNSHFSSFTLQDGALIVEGFGSTARGCGADASAQDRWLADFFAARPQVEKTADRLTFLGAEATLTFLDRELADPDQPLAGATWSIDSFITGDAVSSGSDPASVGDGTITFRQDGTVQVYAYCNGATGRYTVQGDTIVLTDLGYTERGCNDAASLEAHVQSVLGDGDVSFEIEAGRLTITRGELGVSATRAAAP